MPAAPGELCVADVSEDREQPWLHGVAAITVEMAQGAQIAVLHGILRVRVIAHEEMRERVSVIEIWERCVSKTPRALISIF